MDRRRCKRVRREFQVTWSKGDTTFDGVTKDICPGGVFIVTTHLLKVGSTIQIELQVDEPSPLCCCGEVAWTSQLQIRSLPSGFGVRFVDLPDRAFSFFRSQCDPEAHGCGTCRFEQG